MIDVIRTDAHEGPVYVDGTLYFTTGGGSVRRHAGPPSAGRKSTFSRTPQSGQVQSSGTEDHGVPGGKPSRGCPASSS